MVIWAWMWVIKSSLPQFLSLSHTHTHALPFIFSFTCFCVSSSLWTCIFSGNVWIRRDFIGQGLLLSLRVFSFSLSLVMSSLHFSIRAWHSTGTFDSLAPHTVTCKSISFLSLSLSLFGTCRTHRIISHCENFLEFFRALRTCRLRMHGLVESVKHSHFSHSFH